MRPKGLALSLAMVALHLTAWTASAQAEVGYISRYNRGNGQLDKSLSGTGYIIGTGLEGYDSGVTVDSSGRIIVIGNLLSGGFLVGRFNQDGSADSTFGLGGLTRVDDARNDSARRVAVDDRGRIYVLGNGFSGSYVVRFTASGAIDTSYHGGSLTPGFVDITGSNVNSATDFDIAGDGSAAVLSDTGGHGYRYTKIDPTGLVQFNKSDTFDQQGAPFGNGDQGFAIKLDLNGRIVIAGESHERLMAVRRYTTLGNRDGSFNRGSAVLMDFGYPQQAGTDIEVDGAGQIIIVGTSFSNATQAHFLLLRLTDIGAFERQGDFQRGHSTTDPALFMPSLARSGSFYFVATGSVVDAQHYEISLFRLSASTFDFAPSFAQTGWMHARPPGFNFAVPLSLAIDPTTAFPVTAGVVDNR